MYTLGQAAKATGKSKATIAQSIQKGRISAEKDDLGRWQIEPSELHRIYPVASSTDGRKPDGRENGSNDLQTALHRVEILETELRAARKQNEYLEGQIEDLKGQRGQLRADVEAWRSAATQKRLTWRGLFGGGQGGVSGISNEEKIRKAIDSIPSGHVSTYKKIGQQVYHHDRAAQTVGNIISDEMKGWHRVVRSDRSLSRGAPRSQRGLSRTRTN